MRPLLLLAVVLSALCCIWFGYHQPRRLFYLFKPLTMLLIILIAVLEASDQNSYQVLIAGGLVFSLVGDVFMMLPSDQFKAGLTAFLCAHFLYISAFLSFIDIIHWWIPLILFLIGAYLLYRLYPGLGSQIIPVTIYTGVILIMFWTAAEVSLNNPHIGARFLLIGAFLFTMSDFILALNRFQKSFSSARALNLAAYFTAQILIASSIGRLVK